MKLVQPRADGIWAIEFADPKTGKRRRPSTGTRDKEEAKRRAANVYAEAIGEKTPDRSNFFTVGEGLDLAWKNVWSHQNGGNQKLSEIHLVRKRWGKEPVDAVTTLASLKWTEAMTSAGLAASTINSRVVVLSGALKQAVNAGKLSQLPVLQRVTGKNTRKRFVTPAQEVDLRNGCLELNYIMARSPGSGDVMAHLLDVLIYSGMRISEVTKSRPEDLVSSDILTVFDPKSGQENETVLLLPIALTGLSFLWAHPLWQKVCSGLRDIERLHPADLDYNDQWQTHLRRVRSASNWCTQRFTNVRNRLDLPDVSLHVMRHTTASRLVQAGVDLYRVKNVMRHSTISVTEGYSHLCKDDLREGMNALAQTAPVAPEENNVRQLHRKNGGRTR